VLDPEKVVYDVTDFVFNVRQRCQSAVRATIGRMTLSELFGNRSTVTSSVAASLNQFFEENDNCATLCRFEISDISPIGIDLTKQAIAERDKIRQVIVSEADQ